MLQLFAVLYIMSIVMALFARAMEDTRRPLDRNLDLRLPMDKRRDQGIPPKAHYDALAEEQLRRLNEKRRKVTPDNGQRRRRTDRRQP